MTNENKFPHIGRGNNRLQAYKTPSINIDNGSGTTLDHVLFANLPKDAYVIEVQAVYEEATDTAGAADANFKVGVAAAGAEIVASTALEAAKAVGGTTRGTIVDGFVAAGESVFVRHTGIAATEAGSYFIQALVLMKP